MFYAYKVIDGVLHVQTMPDGPWSPMSAAATTAQLLETQAECKRQVEELRDGLRPFAACADHYAPPDYNLAYPVIDVTSYGSSGETRARLTRFDFRRAADLVG